ncbi:hypothetical protein [Sphingomonas montana]|uniref:hypothetical protein n=1 Tax=Sphingomonas montana TaxID=1843236 RepID=UPI00096FCB39|nr:hypothetical protein [Sphingomonas montana]
MTPLRHVLLHHRRSCAWLIAAALLMRLLVPAGFMPVMSAGGVGVAPCSGYAVPTMAMPGMTHHPDAPDKPDHQGKGVPCGFMALTAAGLAAVDPLLLAGAVAFVLAALFRAVPAERIIAAACFRPPLRGPPPHR